MRSIPGISITAGLVLVLASNAGAREPGNEPQAPLTRNAVVVVMQPGQNSPEALDGFGISDEHISTVGWTSFTPYVSSATFVSDTISGERWTTGGSSFLYAPVPEDIPNGADITQVLFYVEDSSVTSNFTGRLCRYYTSSNTGALPGSDCPFSVSTSGTPGNTVAFGDPDVTLLRRADVAGDSDIEVVNWVLHHNQSSALDGSIKILQARILWRRQISPPPGAATFGDVGVGHPQFQFVQALVAAGITAGCGGGNYCPNDPITRGQMAVFLAAALGLHWPAF